jgi:arginine decarboxylase
VQQAPIYSAIKRYMDENNLCLHMPGHMGSQGIIVPELEMFARLDFTEIPGLDDLHLAQSVIADAQNLLAKAVGASKSLFLINGATSGVQALLMSLGDGGRVMIPRNAHRSFYGGLVLSGAMPVYIPSEIEPELGIALAVSATEIENVLNLESDINAIMITSPSYYGTCCDIKAIAAVSKRWGKILLVDEAHGAHFPFHTAYPEPALRDGAQAVVNSLHKTWPVLTQGACLHLAEGFVNRDRLISIYSILTTTSPSYPILASMDLARDFMVREGTCYLEQAMLLSREFKPRLNQIKGIRCYDDELQKIPGVKAIDPLKVLIGVQGLGLSGYQVGRILREEYRIQVEIEEQNLILAMFSLFHNRKDWSRFYSALDDLASRYIVNSRRNQRPMHLPPMPQIVMSPRQAFYAHKQRLKLKDCRGQVAGEMVAAYPPGIPCLNPGEMITQEIWEYLRYLQKSGARVQGPEDPNLEYIKIIK